MGGWGCVRRILSVSRACAATERGRRLDHSDLAYIIRSLGPRSRVIICMVPNFPGVGHSMINKPLHIIFQEFSQTVKDLQLQFYSLHHQGSIV